MTAREALLELVEELSEDKAAEVLEWLEWEVRDQPRVLSAAERAAIDRGLADLSAGRMTDQEEIEREFGLRE